MNARPAGRLRPLVSACALALLALVFGASAAHAFKPYTHIQTGNRAWEDVTDDGQITIEGRSTRCAPRSSPR